VIIDRSFPLAEARAAQRHLEGRGHFGKVVLQDELKRKEPKAI
jgi:NADPH:quinone reductase-like Zn-dependent oxidoreductase